MLKSIRILLFSLAIKLLLIPTKHSTDFEVHRNWLAITHSLPLKEWYTNILSEWTLDYPPFFAWFEYLLSFAAPLFDPRMLDLSSLQYASPQTVMYQKLTVILSDLVLFLAVLRLASMLKSKSAELFVILSTFLTPALLLVDHIHFQYNGLLFGLLIFSFAELFRGKDLIGAVTFAILLNFKHLFLYISLPYFVYLFGRYCFPKGDDRTARFSAVNFLKLSMCTLAVFAVSFGPFAYYGKLRDVLSRLFPFKRGLTHAYWAPNAWAIYQALEICLQKILGVRPTSSFTNGLVETKGFDVLPEISVRTTAILTVLLQLPALWKLWRQCTPRAFHWALVISGLTAFLFGWHVHEKAILIAFIPFWYFRILRYRLILDLNTRNIVLSLVFQMTTSFAVFPLLPETVIKVSATIAHVSYSLASLYGLNRSSHPPEIRAGTILYGLGFIGLQAMSLAQPSLLPYLPFLPLLCTSVYCAFGILYVWFRLYISFLNNKWK